MPESDVSKSFTKLMEAFSPDEERAGRDYLRLHESLTRYFRLRGHTDLDSAADETFDRVQVKLERGAEIEDITKYCFGVARLISLERIRKEKHERTAQVEYYSMRENAGSGELDDEVTVFKDCFDRLPVDDRTLLAEYFADLGFSERRAFRETLSGKYNVSLNHLRLKVFRLRQRLEECVKRKLR